MSSHRRHVRRAGRELVGRDDRPSGRIDLEFGATLLDIVARSIAERAPLGGVIGGAPLCGAAAALPALIRAGLAGLARCITTSTSPSTHT